MFAVANKKLTANEKIYIYPCNGSYSRVSVSVISFSCISSIFN